MHTRTLLCVRVHPKCLERFLHRLRFNEIEAHKHNSFRIALPIFRQRGQFVPLIASYDQAARWFGTALDGRQASSEGLAAAYLGLAASLYVARIARKSSCCGTFRTRLG